MFDDDRPAAAQVGDHRAALAEAPLRAVQAREDDLQSGNLPQLGEGEPDPARDVTGTCFAPDSGELANLETHNNFLFWTKTLIFCDHAEFVT
jgi:hypothetical protein